MHDVIADHGPMALALGGFLVGAAFGWIAAKTNFCTMGALSDIVALGDWRRLRAWVLASATALIATQIFAALGVVDLTRSMYLAPSFDWLGNLVGGGLFGYGMVFAGGCASRNLVRAGGGDLRSLVVLIVIGIAAYAALGGIVGPLRAALADTTAIDLGRAGVASASVADLIARLTGAERGATRFVVAALIGGGALAWCFSDRKFRASPRHVLSGLGVGATIAAGWALTGLAFDELATRVAAPASLTFVRPVGDTLEWLQRFTAAPLPSFAAASTLGTLAGAFLAAWSAGRFRLATFADVPDTLRNLGGAVAMGVGGVLALGCTVGQAVTGVSTLALGSFLTFGALVAGGMFGLRRLEASLMADA